MRHWARWPPVAVAILDVPLFVVASGAAAAGFRAAAVAATGWTLIVAIALATYATITTEAGWGALVMAAAAAGSLFALCLVMLGRVPTEFLIRGPFAFRQAVPRRIPAANVVSTFGQIVVFWGLFLVAIPGAIALVEARWGLALVFPPFTGAVGVVTLVLASLLGLSSAAAMSMLGDGTPLPSAMPNRLVVAGPYRWVRNPMAVSGIVQGVAVGLILSSWLVIVYAVVGSVLWNYAVRPREEADLEERFGSAFVQYRDAVRCWIPLIPDARYSAAE